LARGPREIRQKCSMENHGWPDSSGDDAGVDSGWGTDHGCVRAGAGAGPYAEDAGILLGSNFDGCDCADDDASADGRLAAISGHGGGGGIGRGAGYVSPVECSRVRSWRHGVRRGGVVAAGWRGLQVRGDYVEHHFADSAEGRALGRRMASLS